MAKNFNIKKLFEEMDTREKQLSKEKPVSKEDIPKAVGSVGEVSYGDIIDSSTSFSPVERRETNQENYIVQRIVYLSNKSNYIIPSDVAIPRNPLPSNISENNIIRHTQDRSYNIDTIYSTPPSQTEKYNTEVRLAFAEECARRFNADTPAPINSLSPQNLQEALRRWLNANPNLEMQGYFIRNQNNI